MTETFPNSLGMSKAAQDFHQAFDITNPQGPKPNGYYLFTPETLRMLGPLGVVWPCVLLGEAERRVASVISRQPMVSDSQAVGSTVVCGALALTQRPESQPSSASCGWNYSPQQIASLMRTVGDVQLAKRAMSAMVWKLVVQSSIERVHARQLEYALRIASRSLLPENDVIGSTVAMLFSKTFGIANFNPTRLFAYLTQLRGTANSTDRPWHLIAPAGFAAAISENNPDYVPMAGQLDRAGLIADSLESGSMSVSKQQQVHALTVVKRTSEVNSKRIVPLSELSGRDPRYIKMPFQGFAIIKPRCDTSCLRWSHYDGMCVNLAFRSGVIPVTASYVLEKNKLEIPKVKNCITRDHITPDLVRYLTAEDAAKTKKFLDAMPHKAGTALSIYSKDFKDGLEACGVDSTVVDAYVVVDITTGPFLLASIRNNFLPAFAIMFVVKFVCSTVTLVQSAQGAIVTEIVDSSQHMWSDGRTLGPVMTVTSQISLVSSDTRKEKEDVTSMIGGYIAGLTNQGYELSTALAPHVYAVNANRTLAFRPFDLTGNQPLLYRYLMRCESYEGKLLNEDYSEIMSYFLGVASDVLKTFDQDFKTHTGVLNKDSSAEDIARVMQICDSYVWKMTTMKPGGNEIDVCGILPGNMQMTPDTLDALASGGCVIRGLELSGVRGGTARFMGSR